VRNGNTISGLFLEFSVSSSDSFNASGEWKSKKRTVLDNFLTILCVERMKVVIEDGETQTKVLLYLERLQSRELVDQHERMPSVVQMDFGS